MCLTCKDGYYLKEEVCIICSYPCENCINDTYCLTCGYSPLKRKVIPDCNCLDNLRETNDVVLGCIDCVNGYFITDSKC